MGIFDKVRKLLRGDKPLPNQHGPRVSMQKETNQELEKKIQDFNTPVMRPTRITAVKATTGTKPACICNGGKCACATKPTPKQSKAVTPVTPVSKKTISKAELNRVAIEKNLEDTPVPAVKKAPAKKVTKPVAKEAPKAQPKPAAKKPAPKKK